MFSSLPCSLLLPQFSISFLYWSAGSAAAAANVSLRSAVNQGKIVGMHSGGAK
jgi:hypothetical protein